MSSSAQPYRCGVLTGELDQGSVTVRAVWNVIRVRVRVNVVLRFATEGRRDLTRSPTPTPSERGGRRPSTEGQVEQNSGLTLTRSPLGGHLGFDGLFPTAGRAALQHLVAKIPLSRCANQDVDDAGLRESMAERRRCSWTRTAANMATSYSPMQRLAETLLSTAPRPPARAQSQKPPSTSWPVSKTALNRAASCGMPLSTR